MKKVFSNLIILLVIFSVSSLAAQEFPLRKALICGVCKDIQKAVPNTIEQIELLGSKFDDYGVIIYENNSVDRTANLLAEWAAANPNVVFITETLPKDQLPASREECIARARNIVLSIAKEDRYHDFEHLIMVDLDFKTPWPVDEIVATTQLPGNWDCISANGVFRKGKLYWDRYAFRDKEYPFGPELIGKEWWYDLKQSWFEIKKKELLPVYSGFCGLAVYKRSTIIQFSYSGTVTKDLQDYYGRILSEVGKSNADVKKYMKVNKLKKSFPLFDSPLIFQSSPPSDDYEGYKELVCCEHVTLHASMALSGYGNFFINPRLKMQYSH